MAYDETLANRVREALMDLPHVEEKKMFRGITFMVNHKMCISVSGNELMCRIGPDVYDLVIEKPGVRPMIKNGKNIRNFIYVSQDILKGNTGFNYWVQLSLDFNSQAKSSKTKKIKPKA
jgi:TfoX/Sxy family transcriptional regulator of competence genes